MVSTVASQQEVGSSEFESRSARLTSRESWVCYPAGDGPFWVEFACPAWVSVGALVSSHHQHVHVRLGRLGLVGPMWRRAQLQWLWTNPPILPRSFVEQFFV